MTFTGFPEAALDFYDDLELDNTKSFWEAHKAVYDEAVRRPMIALVEALEPAFGRAKVFRPYRDVRFAKDKTPYKTNQGAFVGAAPSCGFYLELSARGVRTGAGFYEARPADLTRIREAWADETVGAAFGRLVSGLEAQGFERGGERVKTAPRGWTTEHPHIDLLRHKSLYLGRQIGFDPVIHTGALVETVRTDWEALRPLVDWLADRIDVLPDRP